LWHRIEAALAMPIPLAGFTEAGTLDALAELACLLVTEITPADADVASTPTVIEDSVNQTAPMPPHQAFFG
jgi:hypothetical protein